MGIVTSTLGQLKAVSWATDVDPLVLSSEERASPHFVAHTAAGRPIRVSLPRGVELQDGDVLERDGTTAIVVKAKDEDLLFVRPGADTIVWWAACYQLGNLHRPVRFREDGILTPDDPMAAQLLRSIGVDAERVRAPFVGRRFGATGGHHHHQETHDDAAQHQANHRHPSHL